MTAIIPFGKYKGQPVDVLSADEGYRDWLMEQEWFKTRYAPIYQVIVNNFAAPAETPEHNLMQAKLMDELYAEGLVRLLHDQERWYLNDPPYASMEQEGFDACIEYVIYDKTKVRDGERIPADATRWFKAYVECKPTLSDDYPAVLRQMTTASAYTKRAEVEDGITCRRRFVLLVGTFSGAIDREMLRSFFSSRSIMVLWENDIQPGQM